MGAGADCIAVCTKGTPVDRFARGVPLNHVGLVVDDLGAAEAVVKAAGLAPFDHADYA